MIELFVQLAGASAKYITSRIDSPNNQRAYLSVVNQVVSSIKRDNLEFDDSVISLIVDTTEDHLDKLSKKESIFTTKERYILLAHNHLIDIYECLKKRFVRDSDV
jgi:hypothetical protein